MNIIGICGYAGSGKDTIANYLVDKYGYSHEKFANNLVEYTRHLNPYISSMNCNWIDLWEEAGSYEAAKRKYPEFRKVLVHVAEGARNIISEDIWINSLLSKKNGRMVISDCRYENEAREIIKKGGEIWYISRPSCGPANEVEAKTVPDVIKLAKVILNNDSSIDHLYSSIDKLME